MPVFEGAKESPLSAKLLQGQDCAIYLLAGTKIIIFLVLRIRSSEENCQMKKCRKQIYVENSVAEYE